MRACEFCAAEIPDYAEFCGSCGQLTNGAAGMTHISRSMRPVMLEGEQTLLVREEAPTVLTQWSEQREDLINARTGPVESVKVEEDEEEQHRLALVNFNLPLLGDPMTPTANLPIAQGTPQVAGTPTAGGTPPVVSNFPPALGQLVLPDPQPLVRPPGIYSKRLPHRPGPYLPNKPQPAPGCATWLIIVLIIPLVILASIIGIGLTILAPSLSMEGDADVSAGGSLHLHGSHFIPGNAVTCTLDGSTVLTSTSAARPTTNTAVSGPSSSWALAIQNAQDLQARQQAAANTITVNGDGTFSATFAVEQGWSAGQHTIRATEALSPRSASVTFTVLGAGQTMMPDTTVTASASPTTTPSANPTTQAGTGFSAVNPGTVMFGPISQGYNQAVTQQATLSTTGNNLLNWTATWDKTQAPWLQLNPQSGQIQEPATQNIAVGVLAGALQAGAYNATITFSSNDQNAQNVTLNVALTVQAGCVTVTPTTLNFTGTVGANNPPGQTVTLNNCGAMGNWSATGSGGAWLAFTPTSGSLGAGTKQGIIVSTSIAKAGSNAGTYQGQIQFTNGTAHATVGVTFTVQPAPVPPTLSVNATNLTTSKNCKMQAVTNASGVFWVCPVTLSSPANATSNLNWTSTSSGTIPNITIQPASGTLTPDQAATVDIDLPRFPCTETGTATFSGPVNRVSVTVGC